MIAADFCALLDSGRRKGMAMVAPEDFLLSKEDVKAKYAGKGSPDYPTHHEGCGCSGCYASWVEWRGGYAAVQAAQPAIEAAKREGRAWERAVVVGWLRLFTGATSEPMHAIASAIENGEHTSG